MTGLSDRLVFERNRIRRVLGRRWKAAMLLSSGRLFFDFGTLLACVRATGVKPNASLVLLAYAVAGLLALVPITPGGLGIVEAGLSALLILAGVPGSMRSWPRWPIGSFRTGFLFWWAPSPTLAFRMRYGKPGSSQGGSRQDRRVPAERHGCGLGRAGGTRRSGRPSRR